MVKTDTSLSQLYRKTATGSIQVWKIWVEEREDGSVWIMTEYGKEGSDKMRIIGSEIKSGKRKNTIAETTKFEQAVLEAKSKWETKRTKQGYVPKGDFDPANVVVLPMLATKFDSNKIGKKTKGRGINIVFPADIQPKIDGIRALSHSHDGDVVVLSRRNTPYPYDIIKHILDDLKELYKIITSNKINRPRLYLDGEFYTEEMPFEELNGILHSKKIENVDLNKAKQIKFYIFDCFDLDDMKMPFDKRNVLLNTLLGKAPKNIANKTYSKMKYSTLINVNTYRVTSLDEVKQYMRDFISNGYEGLMIRNTDSPYELKKRSKHLQKYKEFIEEEFEIVGFKEGKGEDIGTVIWIVKTKDGTEFSVRPKGTRKHRQQLFNNGDNYIGKMLTVKFFEYSEKNVPRFPVGKNIRYDI